MPLWLWVLLALLGIVVLALVAAAVWIWRSGRTMTDATAELRALGGDLVRLPFRLRRLAADPRVPRRARWLLIGLAIYIVSPIDPIPDFLPGIGHLDEVILVPIILARIRRMIPPDVWAEHFPPRKAT
ncbi:MAG TPA: YkvA family protein [Thermomicrobiales bacterium]|nr:YkvA family protein [Thermomicrobiales bacterium]